jgi:trimethylamine:corrinoid methyltransferase-like protein
MPSKVINRANHARHVEEGSKTLEERAHARVVELLGAEPRVIDAPRRAKLDDIMLAAARREGVDRLPDHEA